MPMFEIRQRLIPYRILAYLLYAPEGDIPWIESISDDEVRVSTGDASRDLRLKNTNLWDALYWLEEAMLVKSVKKEKKRGSAVIKLLPPTNIRKEV